MSVALSRDLAPGTSVKGSASEAGLLGGPCRARSAILPCREEAAETANGMESGWRL